MEAIFNVVLPVFGLVFAGYLAARSGLLQGESTVALNKFVFYVAMPAMLFYAVATLEPEKVLDWTFIGAFVSISFIVMGLTIFISSVFFRRDIADAALASMAGFFGNGVYMGIPLSVIAYGEPALLPAVIASVFQGIFPVIPVVILIELGLNRGTAGFGIIKKLVISLLKNPVVMAPAVGVLWSLTGWPLPVPVDTFAKTLAGAAAPCALFAIGLFLYGMPLHEGAREVGSVVALKLLIHPLVAYVILFHVFELEPLYQQVGLLLSALPTGANAFVLAQQYSRFVQRTSAIILITTVLAVLTLSVLLNLPMMKAL